MRIRRTHSRLKPPGPHGDWTPGVPTEFKFGDLRLKPTHECASFKGSSNEWDDLNSTILAGRYGIKKGKIILIISCTTAVCSETTTWSMTIIVTFVLQSAWQPVCPKDSARPLRHLGSPQMHVSVVSLVYGIAVCSQRTILVLKWFD